MRRTAAGFYPLAYDCRRADFFTGHLLDALRILERGDLSIAQLRGGWAGRSATPSFCHPATTNTPWTSTVTDGATSTSVADMLASTANFLKGHGWQAGQGWEPGSANYAVLKDWIGPRSTSAPSPRWPQNFAKVDDLPRAPKSR